MSDSENYLELELDGRTIVMDISADTALGELDDDMTNIASLISWYGRVLAACERRVNELDDRYRAWRARVTQHVLKNIDAKCPEWKVKSLIEADPQFIEHKNAIRSAEELSTWLYKACEALRVKADILRSRGANIRAELGALGMNTPEETPAPRRRPSTPSSDKHAKVEQAVRDGRERRRRSSQEAATEEPGE